MKIMKILGLLLFSLTTLVTTAAPLALKTPDGFLVPQPGNIFSFPRDHGSHPGFKIEWWYITGHLYASDGPKTRFGFQATFFRQAAPDGTTDIFLSHMAVVNVTSGEFLHQARLNRPGWDASADTATLDLHNGPWSLRLTDPATETMALAGGVRAETTFLLTLIPAKPLVIFGENGVSRKGAGPTAASYYLTFPRLSATGTLQWQGRNYEVSGEAWMDHEISSSQLDAAQVGWDWVSVHFDDQRELMLYRLRLRDGTIDPASALTWVDAAGKTVRQPFTWTVESTWTSPTTGATYPARVRIQTTDPATGAPATLLIEPLVAAQELSGQLDGIPYWEGACRVRNAAGDEIGQAYMELTGYAKDLKL